ncbi:MAG: hypothetical protein J5I94_29070 [Phaeodactylibacter sp.]|nr:hypothetical protein [Phaeodactylibacter sp.]
MNKQTQIKWYAGGVTAITILALGAMVYFFNLSGKLRLDKDELYGQVEGLNRQAASLHQEIDSLMGAYRGLATENEGLRGSVASAEKALADKDVALARIKKQSSKNAKNLQAEVDQLKHFKASLEGELAALRLENENLKTENARLGQELKVAKTEITRLAGRLDEMEMDNQALAQNLARLAPAGMRGSAFRIDVEKRNDKLTVKGRKARVIEVSFDLVDVPEEFQGIHTVYLSVVDSRGLPVKSEQSRSVQLPVKGEVLSFETQQWKEVNVDANQRLSFTVPLDEKIKAGVYRANVYSNAGFLGAANFRVQ